MPTRKRASPAPSSGQRQRAEAWAGWAGWAGWLGWLALLWLMATECRVRLTSVRACSRRSSNWASNSFSLWPTPVRRLRDAQSSSHAVVAMFPCRPGYNANPLCKVRDEAVAGREGARPPRALPDEADERRSIQE